MIFNERVYVNGEEIARLRLSLSRTAAEALRLEPGTITHSRRTFGRPGTAEYCIVTIERWLEQ